MTELTTEAPLVLTITNSQVRAQRRCKRLSYYRYELGMKPAKDNENLRLGTLVHIGLEAWWGSWSAPAPPPGGGAADPLQAAIAAMRKEVAKSDNPDERRFDMAKAEAMLIVYHERWCREPLDVLGVEVKFDAPLVNPTTGVPARIFRRAGKIDAIVRDRRDGRVMVVEHKTTSEDASPGSDYCRRLTLDSQVSDYYVGARTLGFNPQGCIYDILGKPTIRPHKATPPEKVRYKKDGTPYADTRLQDETPEEFFQRLLIWYSENADRALHRALHRVIVVRTEEDELEGEHDFYGTARDIRDSQLSGRWPRNPDACVRFGETCAFFDVCTRVASLEDPTRFRKSTTQHEELT